MNYLSTNEKLARSGIASWGIPAYRSQSGLITCPGAKACIQGCYARQGRYYMPSVKNAQEKRLALALSDQFVETISAEIKKKKVSKLRVHDSGDFFSVKYLLAWFEIAKQNPKVLFYAYTKMIPLLSKYEAPGNFVLIQSCGGKWDAKIDLRKRHSRVFASRAELKKHGYVDASKVDSRAFGDNPRVGLIYHGAASKQWLS